MHSTSTHAYVASFLKRNGYLKTLKAFEQEHGEKLPLVPLNEPLEAIVWDRLEHFPFSETESEPLHVTPAQSRLRKWARPCPEEAHTIGISKLIVASAKFKQHFVLATNAKDLYFVDIDDLEVKHVAKNPLGVVVRRIAVCGDNLLLCGMDGRVTRCTFEGGLVKHSTTQLHSRLVLDMKVVKGTDTFVVSLGWDSRIKVHKLLDGELALVAETKMSDPGACLDAFRADSGLVIVVGKKDITLLDVYRFETTIEPKYRVALNEAEFSASGFSPRCIRCLPGPEPLVAVATSHEPFMRVVVASLSGWETAEGIKRNQIVANINTLSPQDKYSQSQIEWRSDGSGLWVAGDDGNIRGLDISTGKVAATLNGHTGRIKSFFAENELVFSAGIDERVVLWRISK